MEPLLALDSLGAAFRGRTVLKAASAWARKGEIAALLGRNGSGKTMLLKAALGMVPLNSGVVRYGEETYLKPTLHELARRGLFFLPDRGLLSRRRTLGWHLSSLRRQFPGECRSDLPLPLSPDGLLDKKPWRMSGGEERRAGLTLAWARGSACLLADEPLAGLAPKDQERVAGTLRSLAEEGCAILLTGHDVVPLLALAHRVIWMTGGTTHVLGTPEEARVHDLFRREYLGTRP